MAVSRRGFLSAIGALAVTRDARADRRPPVPCSPPAHQARIDRAWRRLPDEIRPSGFVNYFDEPFPFPSRIAPGILPPVRTSWRLDAMQASCATADPNALARKGSLVDALLSDRPSESCLHVGDEPERTLIRLANELRDAVVATPSDAVLVPVGGHHSCSGAYRPASFGNAVAVDTGGINVVYPLDARGPNGGPLVVCGAGMSVCQLNETLWKMGLALPTMGSFDVQTLAGATSTGTHGSAAHVGATSDMVVAIVALACPRDRWTFVQIQSRETDAPRLALAEHLVADDDVFQAFVVSMGLLGIFVAMVIEVREPFWLYRRRYARRWREIRPEMAALASGPPAGVRGRGWRYELYLNPVPVRRFLDFPLDEPSVGSTGAPEWIAQELQLDEWDDDLDYHPGSIRLDATNQLLAELQEDFDIRSFRPSGEITSQFFEDESGEFVDRSYRTLRLEWTDSLRVWATEWFVPMEHAADAVDWMLERNVELGYGHPDHLIQPVGVRFVRSRQGLLCPSRYDGDRFSCAIEPSTPVRSGDRANAEQRAVLVRWGQAFVEESERRGWTGRFHWGLLNDPFDRRQLEASYPQADTWREVFLAFNRHGRFDTTLGRQLGLPEWREAQGGRPTRFDPLLP